jgi:hypothetical protein
LGAATAAAAARRLLGHPNQRQQPPKPILAGILSRIFLVTKKENVKIKDVLF